MRLLVTGVVVGLYLALGLAAVDGWVATFALIGAVVGVIELALAATRSLALRLLDVALLDGTLRLVARDGLLLLLVARADEAPRWLLGAAVGLRVLGHVARVWLLSALRTLEARSLWPLRWRNMQVPSLDLPPQGALSRGAVATGAVAADLLGLPVAFGVLAVAAGWPAGWLGAGVALTVVVVLAVVVPVGRRASVLPARTREDVVDEVRAAVEGLAPRVVAYFGGPPSSTHALNVWVPVLEQMDLSVLVVVRQEAHLDQLESERLPAVWLPRAADVEGTVVPSMDLAMYPTNIAQNNHLIRVPGILDVFVGHGDSDKGGSSTPLSRIYDEIWVAGPAGRDRYRVADVGVRDEQVHEVGRPQLAEIVRLRPQEPVGAGHDLFTVLYAPTWEGFYAGYGYSSLLHMGERIVQGLLTLEGVRVLVKPHPASGSVDPAYGAASNRVVELVRRAGEPHAEVTGLTGLYEAFNHADMLVSDVSSVVTDFLWSAKPYAMTNPADLPEDEFRREFPSSRAAAVWGRDLATLAADVADARGADVRRVERERLAAYLLGPLDEDPTARFVAAVHERLGAST